MKRHRQPSASELPQVQSVLALPGVHGIESIVTTPPATPTPTPMDMAQNRPSRPHPTPRGHIGWVVAGSLTAGLLAALLLVAAPFIADEEPAITGAVLCGFALGWAMLAVLSVRHTDQPQGWAAVPAAFMGLGGLLLLAFGSSIDPVLSWVWPPALLALVVRMVVQSRRHLRSWSRRWLLYPVIGMLTVAAVGGGYETLGAATDARPVMAGRSIDVGGHSLRLHCTGTGSPTVVLQPGGGAMSSDMGWIAPRVAADTRVCVYDRRVAGGAKQSAPPRTPLRSPPTCIPCCDAGTSPAPTCWQATPSVGCTCSPTPPATPIRSPGWSSWTPPHRTRHRLPQAPPSPTATTPWDGSPPCSPPRLDLA